MTPSDKPVCSVCAARVAAGQLPCECVYCASSATSAQCPWGHDYPRSCPSAEVR